MRAVIIAVVASIIGFWAIPAQAYPWMIRHGETGCAICHTDPSGAGLLNPWGRAQSELLLSTRYGHVDESADASRLSGALFGLVPLPQQLDVGGWLRGGYIWVNSGGVLVDKRALLMRADLGAQLRIDRFRASATIGYATSDAAAQSQQAYLIRPHVVSREHWAGADLDDGRILIRGGRMNLPFGLRNIEHNSWIRSATRTDINQSQQHGLAVAYHSDVFRAEGMAILGNYQLRPDAYRERGFAGYAEFALGTTAAVGASVLLTHAELDIASARPTLRQTHGLFGRVSFWQPLVFLAEANLLVATSPGVRVPVGHVEFLQADLEFLRGLHLLVTGENLRETQIGGDEQFGAWGSVAWFFLPHFDVRVDAIHRWSATEFTTILAQLHGYL